MKCRNCGTEKPIPAAYGDITPAGQQEVEDYLAKNMIQDHAAASFRELPGSIQALVMSAGGLADARDPTAVLISRMAKAKNGTLQPERKMPCDWDCPGCGDHQFARNTICRKCSTPNPNQGGKSW